jgi:hypothetical protein
MRKPNKLLSFLKEPAVLVGLFFILIVSMGGVSAEQGTLGCFKQDYPANLIQTCDDCGFNNITTILLGDKTLIVINEPMQKDSSGKFYNYTLNSTYSLGTYQINGVGNDSSGSNWNFDIQVTPNGLCQSTSQGIGSMIYLVLMVILMFVFGFLGFRLAKTQNLWIFGIFFMFLSLLFLVYNTWLGYEYHRLFTGLQDSSIPETIFYIFLMLLVLGFLISLALLFLRWKEVFRYIKREIKRKESSKEEEDWDMDEWMGEDWKIRNQN